MKKNLFITLIISALGALTFFFYERSQAPSRVYEIGESLDSLNHVVVYYNGGMGNVSGRNTSPDGYNIGLKYQCVEFVKRYYYEHYKHKMPNAYGNAIDFFDKRLVDGQLNAERDLIQYTNPSKSKPKVGDLIIMDATFSNEYGHVVIVSKVTTDEVEIIQQNAGNPDHPRDVFDLDFDEGNWEIDNGRILGWLRMRKSDGL
ncbi:CHAP domain-containing protein [Fluviicola taffensis]|uniref:CHAP domain containing protein n=1 Tax=Fluviicola taffensis (strain DSM 16823 / NCIMB 13979 / RW262) TaxID=755732 RepID=F2IC60_FLUTR|nr:CHAP domain-containing protein [Fluviicola taffensis]AEA43286.1 CHAP domain containing protein [Fluviicola taffensis DSM 16823]